MSLVVVSIRNTMPALSYISIDDLPKRCFTQDPLILVELLPRPPVGQVYRAYAGALQGGPYLVGTHGVTHLRIN